MQSNSIKEDTRSISNLRLQMFLNGFAFVDGSINGRHGIDKHLFGQWTNQVWWHKVLGDL